MMTIEDPRGPVDYEESGHGPTVVLAPGSCSTGAAWRPIVAHCEGRYRCVTTSLPGYGGSAERRTGADASIAHVAAALEAVIRRAGRPAHLVGHSFGGLVALAVALRRLVPLASLSILEAPAAQLLDEVGEAAHYHAFRQMTDAYLAAVAAGKADAIATMIDFYGGAGTFAAWPPRVRAYAAETTAVNVRDWASAYGFRLTPALLASLELPVLIIRGGSSHVAVRRANELIARYCPGAALATIEGAAHFMITTHAREVAALLGRHIGRASAGA
ncbi:MAG TPA: alpha/beta fold hydrolase [Hyphomicrobiaceae bacterium]|nr:alpha/beta fold hydrolase [Hyphomicrobiaceae bacterium]